MIRPPYGFSLTEPPFGFCSPVEYRRCLDGDTVAVSILNGSHETRIRLLDCWCPELRTQEGREAKQYAEKLMEQCMEPAIYIPMQDISDHWAGDIMTFGRFLGHVFLNDHQTLNEMLVAADHAEQEKPEKT